MDYLRIYRRIRIAPGLTVNLAKHGASLSCGICGAHITVGRHGIRRTVGLHGTGIFYTHQDDWHSGIHTGEHFTAGEPVPPTWPRTIQALPLFLLGLILGLFGVHRFYCGRIVSGLAMLILTVSGAGMVISLLWWLMDLVFILTGEFHDKYGNKIGWRRVQS